MSDVTLPEASTPNRRRRAGALVALIAGLLAALFVPGVAIAPAMTGKPVNTLGSAEGIAIRGYDPVAYFRDGGPRPSTPSAMTARPGISPAPPTARSSWPIRSATSRPMAASALMAPRAAIS